jgi:hypothetical protein
MQRSDATIQIILPYGECIGYHLWYPSRIEDGVPIPNSRLYTATVMSSVRECCGRLSWTFDRMMAACFFFTIGFDTDLGLFLDVSFDDKSSSS